MSNAIVVLNAGSSSIKFSLFLDRGASLEAETRGQIEGLYTAARFVAKKKDGALKYEESWPAGALLGHDGALDYLVAYHRANSKKKTPPRTMKSCLPFSTGNLVTGSWNPSHPLRSWCS